MAVCVTLQSQQHLEGMCPSLPARVVTVGRQSGVASVVSVCVWF